MEIGVEIKEKFSLVSVMGDMGEGDFERLGHTIDTLMTKGYMHVVLDLSGVFFINANGLAALMSDLGRVRFHRGDFRIVGLNSRIMALFRAMGVDTWFDLYKNVQEMMEKTHRFPVTA